MEIAYYSIINSEASVIFYLASTNQHFLFFQLVAVTFFAPGQSYSVNFQQKLFMPQFRAILIRLLNFCKGNLGSAVFRLNLFNREENSVGSSVDQEINRNFVALWHF